MDSASCIIGPGTCYGLCRPIKPCSSGVVSVTKQSIVLSALNITENGVRWS